MAIIRSATIRQFDRETSEFRESEVPFVPAWDLLQAQESALLPEEVAAVALALHHLTSESSEAVQSAWNIHARLDAISQRF